MTEMRSGQNCGGRDPVRTNNSDNDSKPRPLSFVGSSAELFGIHITNTLLTVFSLGIYCFWGRLRLRKYLYEQSYFLDESFEFHATGDERLLNFLTAVLFVGTVVGGLVLTALCMRRVFGVELPEPLKVFALLVAIVVLTALVAVKRRSFLLARSSWNGFHFEFAGRVQELLLINLIGVLLSFLTLGLFWPWLQCERRRFFTNNSKLGGTPFSYSGSGFELLTLQLYGFLLSVLSLGLYLPWWRSSVQQYHWRSTGFQGIAFALNLDGFKVLRFWLYALGVTICSFGLGLPFLRSRYKVLVISNLWLLGLPKLHMIKNSDADGPSTFTDGFQNIAEVVESIGDAFS